MFEEFIVSDNLRIRTDGNTVQIVQTDPFINPPVILNSIKMAVPTADRLVSVLSNALQDRQTVRKTA
jgi:hypothetical protein